MYVKFFFLELINLNFFFVGVIGQQQPALTGDELFL